jgi:L-lactate dehydrogenase
VFVAGTFPDSLRFRTHLARHFGVAPSSADGTVIGEHGTTSVLLWSSAWIADARHANITIIEGIVASQYRTGIVSARLAEAVLRDEKVYSSRIEPSSGIWSQPLAAIGDRGSWR